MSNIATIVHMKTSNQYIITLPKSLIEALRWHPGDQLEFTATSKDGRVIVNLERVEGKQKKQKKSTEWTGDDKDGNKGKVP